MNGTWTTVSIILPQAIRIVIPPLTNELVALIKDTSLLFVVGMQADQVELSAFGREQHGDLRQRLTSTGGRPCSTCSSHCP